MDPLPNFLDGIAGEINSKASGYNVEINSEHAFNNLAKAKKKMAAIRTWLEHAKTLDPRLEKPVGAGLANLDALERDGSAKVEQICNIYLNVTPPIPMFKFDSRYAAFNWCSANPKNRWMLFPQID